jgi:hypothetical protein
MSFMRAQAVAANSKRRFSRAICAVQGDYLMAFVIAGLTGNAAAVIALFIRPQKPSSPPEYFFRLKR